MFELKQKKHFCLLIYEVLHYKLTDALLFALKKITLKFVRYSVVSKLKDWWFDSSSDSHPLKLSTTVWIQRLVL